MLGMGSMSTGDVVLIVFFVIAAVFGGLYFLNRWASKKVVEQDKMIEKNKQVVSIYVIDKKKMKAQESNLPRAVIDNIPKWYRFMKMPLVKAKIGPQIATLMCDKKAYDLLPIKKNVKVTLAGMYIVDVKTTKIEKATPVKKPWYSFLKRS